MHQIKRRLSPSYVVAFAALFVALAGTATAAVIIDSPDDIADSVVTGPKLAPNSISSSKVITGTIGNNDLDDPQLKVRATKLGGVLPDSDGTVEHVGAGEYLVTFQASKLHDAPANNTLLSNNCVFTATPRDGLAWMSVTGPAVGQPNTVRVLAAMPNPGESGLIQVRNTAFDLTATC
jgi:hypothetical protein